MLNIKQLTWLLDHPNLLQNQNLFRHVPLEMFNRPMRYILRRGFGRQEFSKL